MSESGQKIAEAAARFASKNKKRIARSRTDTDKYPPEAEPVSVFMAGSPGAGKTEASKWLISLIAGDDAQVLRIDPDELRDEFDDYDGSNSALFQRGVSTLVAKIHDMALQNNQSFVLDGTFSNYDKAAENIRRSLKRDRKVTILYVFQDAQQAWTFVEEREVVEGRKILPQTFVDQYFAARDVVNKVKQEFGKQVTVDLLIKELDGTHRLYKANIDKIDNHVPEKYSRAQLQSMIK